MYIAIDFDGTCVTHDFPEIGKSIGAEPVLKRLVKCGHKLILHTMRDSNEERSTIQEAVNWFRMRGIPLEGVNYNPSQSEWTNSNKVFADLYIDDLALGVPLIYNPKISSRPFVDWIEVKKYLLKEGILW